MNQHVTSYCVSSGVTTFSVRGWAKIPVEGALRYEEVKYDCLVGEVKFLPPHDCAYIPLPKEFTKVPQIKCVICPNSGAASYVGYPSEEAWKSRKALISNSVILAEAATYPEWRSYGASTGPSYCGGVVMDNASRCIGMHCASAGNKINNYFIAYSNEWNPKRFDSKNLIGSAIIIKE